MIPFILKYPQGSFLKNRVVLKSGSTTDYWPHLFDVYIPVGEIDFVTVILHGAGGGKVNIANTMGVTYSNTQKASQVNWTLLTLMKSVVIIPQGQHCDGTVGPFNPNGVTTVSLNYPNGVATWSNYNMWSGADDKSFLQDLVANYIEVNWPGKSKVLAGHSNGGMMAQTMWLESPATFDMYGSFSGPAAYYYDQNPIPTPSVIKPMFQRYSMKDTVLGISGGVAGAGDHFWDNLWYQQPAQASVANYTYPTLGGWVSGWRMYEHGLTTQGKTFSQAAYFEVNQIKGWQRRWELKPSQGVRMTMDLISEGAHNLDIQRQATGRQPFYDLMTWCRTTRSGVYYLDGMWTLDGTVLLG